MNRARFLVPLAALVLGIFAFIVVQGQGWMVNRDWFTYWGGGRGLLNGVNLYGPGDWAAVHRQYGSTWLENPIFIYAPPTAAVFAPFAALSVELAGVLWVWLSEVLVVVSVWIMALELRWRAFGKYVPWLFLTLALFLPVLLTLLMGQVSALSLALLVASALLWNHSRWFSGGLVFGLLVVKPQPVILVMPLMALWLLIHRRWQGLFGLALLLGLNALGSWLLYPSFLSDWLATVTNKVGGVISRMPTVWGIAYGLVPGSPAQLWTAPVLAVAILVFGIIVVLRWRGTVLQLMSTLVVLSVLATLYLWNYDRVLLLMPLIVALAQLDQRGVPRPALVLVLLGMDILAIALFAIASVRLRDTFGVLITLASGLLLWVSLQQSRSAAAVELDT